MRTKSDSVLNTTLFSSASCSAHNVTAQRNNRRPRGLRQRVLTLCAGGLLGFSSLAWFSAPPAHADFMQQPVQELLQTDDPVTDIPRERDYTIDHQPQYAEPDTEALLDANDADTTTPLAAFLFWLVMGSIIVGALVYSLLRTRTLEAR